MGGVKTIGAMKTPSLCYLAEEVTHSGFGHVKTRSERGDASGVNIWREDTRVKREGAAHNCSADTWTSKDRIEPHVGHVGGAGGLVESEYHACGQ